MSTEKTSWKDKALFLCPDFEVHTINGQELRFYPISMVTLFKTRKLAKPLATALRTLFSQNQGDVASTFRRVADSQETIVSAIGTDLAKFRADQMDMAVHSLLDALIDEKNADILGEVVVDSLRDEFPRGSMDSKQCAELLKSMDVVTQMEMLKGLAKANKKVLGPLGDLLAETITRLAGNLTSVVTSLKAVPEAKTTEPKTAS